MTAAKQDAAIFEHIRQLRQWRDAWLALPPGEARIAAIRDDFMPWVCSLLQELSVDTALVEIASAADPDITAGDTLEEGDEAKRERQREHLLKGYPAVLGVLRLILPLRDTDLLIGDLKTMADGHAPLALYPLAKKQAEARLREIQERCVLRAEYDAGLRGIRRKKVLERRNVLGKRLLPVSRLNRWAQRVSTEQKRLFFRTGEKKKRTGVALSAEEQKALEAVERNTLEELIELTISMGGLSGSRRRYRPPRAKRGLTEPT